MLPSCLILAGGLATRMRPQTSTVPKSLIPVRGKPFVSWQLQWLAEQSVHKVVMSIGYLGEMIRNYVRDGEQWNIDVQYVDEGSDLRGTGGAVRFAIDQSVLNDEQFFVLYGDSYLTIDLAQIFATWKGSNCSTLMTVFDNRSQWDRSNATFDGKRVFYDKESSREDMHWIDYGVSLVSRSIVLQTIPSDRVSDMAEFFSQRSKADDLAGFEAHHRFYEIGSHQGLADLEKHLANKQ